MGKKKKLINRERYEATKKMDHTSMSEFFENVWSSGYDKGKREAESRCRVEITTENIKKALMNVKGIGEVKAALIMKEINKLSEQ